MYDATHGNQIVVCVEVLDYSGSRKVISVVVELFAVKRVSKRRESARGGVAVEPVCGAIVLSPVVVPGANAASAQVGAGGLAERAVVREPLDRVNDPNRCTRLAIGDRDRDVPDSFYAVVVLGKGYMRSCQGQRDGADAKNIRPHVQSPPKWTLRRWHPGVFRSAYLAAFTP